MRNGLCALFPFAVVLSSMRPLAQPLPWSLTTPPSTAYVTQVAAAGNAFLAGTAKGFLYRSEDAGLHWTQTYGVPGYPVGKFLVNGQDIYASRSTIYNPLADCFSFCQYPPNPPDLVVSHDGGKTWSALALGNIQSLARARDGVIWAMSNTAVYHLDPGQAQWKKEPFRFGAVPANFPKQYSNSSGLAVRGPYLLAILNGYLFSAPILHPNRDSLNFDKLSDEPAHSLISDSIAVLSAIGNSISRIYAIGPSPDIRIMNTKAFNWLDFSGKDVLGINTDGLQRSPDLGLTWLPLGTALKDTISQAAVIGRDVLVINGASHSLMLSHEDGAWLSVGSGFSETTAFPLLVTQGSIFASTYSGIMQSKPETNLWTSFTNSIGTTVETMIDAVGTLWAGGSGLSRGVGSPVTTWQLVAGQQVYDLASSGNRIVAAMEEKGDPSRHILTICDGAAPCRTTTPGQLGASKWLMGTYFSHLKGVAVKGENIFASDSLLYRSRDGGTTWDIAHNWGMLSVSQMAFLGGSLFASVSGGDFCYNCLVRSDDLGVNWSPADTLGLRNARSTVRLITLGGRLYAATRDGVFATQDGNHWVDLGLPVDVHPNAMVGDETNLAVGADGAQIWYRKLEVPVVDVAAPSDETIRKSWIKIEGAVFRDRSGLLRRADGTVLK